MVAFLVFYAPVPAREHSADLKHLVLYLDQRFYELIYQRCRSDDGPYDVLRQLALLRYKSPTAYLSGERLAVLIRDLAIFEGAGGRHPQFPELRQVCESAVARGWGLTISGDMYPELWRGPAESGAEADGRRL